jgi:hypothetical protein
VKAALFVLTGIESLVYWVVVHPTSDVTTQQASWPYVLWFSATLLLVGSAVLVFGRLMGGEGPRRWAIVAFVAISLASLANIVEDGFHVDEAFLLFITTGLAFDIALIALAIAIALTAESRHRLLAVVPLGTLAAILFFVAAGGPMLLIAWLIAAAAALRMPLTKRVAAASILR